MHQPNEYKKEDIYGNPKTPSKSVGTIRCENNDITPIKTKDVKYILILLSLYVAYSRVNSKHHTIYDVSASLLISAHISRIQTTYFNKYFKINIITI